MKPLFLLVCVLLASSFFIPISAMPIQDQPLGGERKGKECGRGTKCIPTKPPHRRCKGNSAYCRPP
ncbi:hypothetical protein E1A91_A11G309900v1 [Gossypium mustelinum]|uniref:Uncharacterized protein n=4 Tax=Gossypium TaxID=3633 RepID=A0A5J5TZP0_GOSBA|nr:hypothetical protein ES319_A11G306800v1 [Gossypium barbadense]TYG96268.1 hypothetical protein ES288_A11G335900v1 [Gossypium darwinii]TYH78305.1 hypothetical protein ES332_D04G217300v1 [Gossypium tomentosum]TYI03283.1 hypothetical protein ES332_A11G327100v1 [Gossypium tomentosum]TYJ11904.1 hypothetical protein E1A91_A11G309900v1 [Gossypium mustelinum]